VKRQKRGK